ncbi:DUF3404 domain-containing protein [Endozoicomonas sp. SM1973]|uniref:histidine kinase n=1 Tax=Spartinivicinus marinus TaxID=2994442 RepID=A0A853IBG6_9GAMM|nr:DUF3404 domain-containing protein [Spartinivicinus marinus]MCX4028482.1 DUF3404 domain-containing protein [Spartinivicinus marinus]NYZ67404.1 DUF3404 domain-containing protein [Spartinivicinus marinus]
MMRLSYLVVAVAFGFCQPRLSLSSELSVKLNDNWERFVGSLITQPAKITITQQRLNQYPVALLLPSALYPDLTRYSWQQIAGLHHLNKTCAEPKGIELPARAKEFELALCRQQLLPINWFKQGELNHPAGGSYAGRYLKSVAKFEVTPPSAEVKVKLSQLLVLGNSDHPLHDQLMPLGPEGLNSLLNLHQWYLHPDGSLWFYNENGISQYENNIWLAVAKNNAIDLVFKSNTNICQLAPGNFCIQEKPTVSFIRIILEGGLVLLSIFLLTKLLLNRYLEAKERGFILQLLTHELRTPIASLAMTVEQFRDAFDELSPSLQDSFSRLTFDYQRLKQLTNTSQGYLSEGKKSFLDSQPILLSEWLEYLCAKYNIVYSLDQDNHCHLPVYWLGICLENLIRNSLEYGKPPIRLLVTHMNKYLVITVQDAGDIPSTYLYKLIRSNHQLRGMGIGLRLVKRIIKQLGGKLKINKCPTRFTIEYPL